MNQPLVEFLLVILIVVSQFESINNMAWERCIKEDNADGNPQGIPEMCGYHRLFQIL